MTIRQILFPIDFSEHSRAVTPFVLSLANRHQAGVTVIHAVQPPPPLYAGPASLYPETFDYTEVRKALLKRLEEFAVSELPKVDVTSVVDIGDPAYIITDYTRNHAIDIICMASHGHGPFRRALLGSVTAKVLHDTSIPVWMDAHAPEPSHRAHPQPRHILVAIDPGETARETLHAAMSTAKETSATLDIVTAVGEGSIAPGVRDAQLEALLIEGTREEIAQLQFEAGTGFGTIIEIGNPAKVIRDAAIAKRADLIVAGRGLRHGVLGRLQDNGYAIIRDAPCPVLSV